MNCPVYIPSKGRAGRAPAIDLFCRIGMIPIVFVEPEDVQSYIDLHPKAYVINIKARNKGMAFVRNFMQDFAHSTNVSSYWQIDDDIQSFHYRDNWDIQRVRRISELELPEMLTATEYKFLGWPRLAYACLQWRNTAWCATKPFTHNRKCGLVTWCSTEEMRKFKFRGVLRSDIDMSLQLLAAGYRTATYNRLSFAAPGCGLNRVGGLSKQYDLGSTEHKAVKAFVSRWKPWASLRVTSSGRPDVKIDWNKFLTDHRHPDAKA